MRGSVEEVLDARWGTKCRNCPKQPGMSAKSSAWAAAVATIAATLLHGDVTLKVPKIKVISFNPATIEWHCRQESSVEEELIKMYLSGVPTRRVENITETMWSSKVSHSTTSELKKKVYVYIATSKISGTTLCRADTIHMVSGEIYQRSNWGSEFEDIAIQVAIAVNGD